MFQKITPFKQKIFINVKQKRGAPGLPLGQINGFSKTLSDFRNDAQGQVEAFFSLTDEVVYNADKWNGFRFGRRTQSFSRWLCLRFWSF